MNKTLKSAGKRLLSITFAALLLSAVCVPTLAAAKANAAVKRVDVKDQDMGAVAVLDNRYPDQTNLGNGKLEVSASADGNPQMASLLQLPLPTGIEPNQVVSAVLRLRRAGGDNAAIKAGAVTHSWTMVEASWSAVSANVDNELSSGSVQQETDGWCALDVTDIVKAWLSGDVTNFGVFLTQSRSNTKVSYYSIFDETVENRPQLEIRYTEKMTPTGYGRFGYTPQDDGNCLSYALRDLDAVYTVDKDRTALQAAYDKDGIDGALNYFKTGFLDYVEAHQDALEIRGIRELSSYDDPIDADREYIIAMRIGLREYNGAEGLQLDSEFDYHFRVLLNNGCWAEKFPKESSRMIPGSNASNRDISKYAWDQSYLWGYEKWSDFYNSDIVYFAVEKSTDSFTSHLSDHPSVRYDDTEGHWASTAIGNLTDLGVLRGHGGLFRPDAAITRAELAVILNRILAYDIPQNGVPYDDAEKGAWYYDDVSAIAAAGILQGSGGLIRPLDNVTREEAVVMVARAFEIDSEDGAAAFADAEELSPWAVRYVDGMRAKCYISGDGSNNFRPKANITRGEAAALLDKMKGLFPPPGSGGQSVNAEAPIFPQAIHEYGITQSIVDHSEAFSSYILYPETGIESADAAISAWTTQLYESLRDEVLSVREQDPDAHGELNVQYSAYRAADRYIGIVMQGFYNSSLLAHPIDIVWVCNIDLKEEKLLTNEQILSTEKTPEILSLLNKKLAEAYPDSLSTPEDINADWLEYCILGHEQLDIVLEKGTYLPTFYGTVAIGLPLSALGDSCILPDITEPPAAPDPQPEPEAQAGERPPIDPDKPMIALTFDDGPSSYTQRILDTLSANGGRATFCMVGNRVGTYPEIVANVKAQGSEIVGHSWDHKDLTKLSKAQVIKQLEDTNNALIDAGAELPAFFRPPYGAVNSTVKAAGKELDMILLLWSVDPEDWRTHNADSTYEHIMSHVKDGGIILCHDLYKATADAMDRVIPALVEQGYQLVTVSELLEYGSGLEPGEIFYNVDRD